MNNKKIDLVLISILIITYLCAMLALSGCGACNKNFCWSSREEMNRLLIETIEEQQQLCNEKLKKIKQKTKNLSKKINNLEETIKIKDNVLKNRQFIIQKSDETIKNLQKQLKTAKNKVKQIELNAEQLYYEYIIVKNDWLSKIAKKAYKNYKMWAVLWKANPEIEDPNLIYPKQKIKIPVVIDENEALKIHKERFE